MADMKVAIEVPAGTRRPVGLLLDEATAAPSTATNGEMIGRRWLHGVRWTSLSCDPLLTQPADDCTYTQDLDAEDFPDVVEQSAFNIYDSLNCSTLSDPADDIRRRLQGRMDLMESAAFATELITATASGGISLSSEATVPLASSVTTVLNALSVIESHLASTLHGGVGMIHISPALLPVLAGQTHLVYLSNGAVRTLSGHVVVSDAGYINAAAPDGESASASAQDWVYGSGPVRYYTTTPTFRGLPGEQVDYIHNRIDSFIEEYGLLLFEPCATVAVLASYSVS